ncbi:hypothetical protein CEXT_143921 [Caerostris extrusa]|uniref:Uncharacterized protein n=1 Tax=Caerostris extrusa TaxID=172846 RepID=A0AAV4VDY8_CAEEX|nr:hypothetical protein CEXT_143921 [Caerostris extrusa]
MTLAGPSEGRHLPLRPGIKAGTVLGWESRGMRGRASPGMGQDGGTCYRGVRIGGSVSDGVEPHPSISCVFMQRNQNGVSTGRTQ